MDYIGWLIAFIAFIGFELVTMGLTSIWFAVGALVAFIAGMLGANAIVQWILFIVVTAAVIVFIRPFALKYINNKTEKTNVEAMQGKVGKVTVQINNIEGTGEIFVDGLTWTARTENGEILEAGDLATVIRIEGVKAIVQRKDNN